MDLDYQNLNLIILDTKLALLFKLEILTMLIEILDLIHSTSKLLDQIKLKKKNNQQRLESQVKNNLNQIFNKMENNKLIIKKSKNKNSNNQQKARRKRKGKKKNQNYKKVKRKKFKIQLTPRLSHSRSQIKMMELIEYLIFFKKNAKLQSILPMKMKMENLNLSKETNISELNSLTFQKVNSILSIIFN